MRRLVVGVLISMLWMSSWASWAAPQGKKPTIPPKVVNAANAAGDTSPSDDAFDALGVQIPTLQQLSNERAQLKAQMREWQRFWAQKKYSQAKGVLASMKQLRLDLGLNNVFGIAQLLMQAGAKADAAGNTEQALLAYREASVFAPALPEPYYRHAWLTLRSNPVNAYQAVKSTLAGIRRHSRDIFGISALLVNALRYIAWVFGIALLLFWIILLLRSLRLFQSDFRDLFPHGVTAFQIQLLSLFLLFLPLLMGAGLLETLLCWVFISWFYQTKGERILTTFGLLLLSAAPYAADLAGKLTSLVESPLASVYLLNESEMGRREERRLERLTRRGGPLQKDVPTLWSLGLYHKRNGNVQTARVYYKRALKIKQEPAVMINLANLDLGIGRVRSAYNGYRKALKRRGIPEGQYNLSLLYQYSTSTGTSVVGQKVHALTAARAGGGERIERFIKRTKPRINRFAMDVQLPYTYYLRGLQKLRDKAALKQQLWSYAATWIPLTMAPWVGFSMILLLWLLLPVGRRFFCGLPCDKCGDVVGRREQKGIGGKESQCTQCLQMSGKRDGISAERRVKKEMEIQRFRRRRSYLLMAFAVACLGGGQLLLRESARAFFLMLIFATALFMWLCQPPLLVHPLGLGSAASMVWLIVWTALAAMLYLRAVRDVYYER